MLRVKDLGGPFTREKTKHIQENKKAKNTQNRTRTYAPSSSAERCLAPAKPQVLASSLILSSRICTGRSTRLKVLALRSSHNSQFTRRRSERNQRPGTPSKVPMLSHQSLTVPVTGHLEWSAWGMEAQTATRPQRCSE